MRRTLPRVGVQGRILVLVTVGLAVLLGVAASGEAAATAAVESLGAAQTAHQVQVDSLDVTVGMVDQETGLRGYTGTAEARFIESFDQGRGQTTVALAAMGRARLDASFAALVNGVAGAVAAWEAWADGRRAAIAAAAHPVADAVGDEQGRGLFDRFRALADALGGVAASRAAAAAVLVVGLVAGLLAAGVVRPLRRLVRAANRVAAGEPAAVPGLDRHDEVGRLAMAIAAWGEAEALGAAVVRHAGIGVARIGADGRFLSANAALCSVLGYTPFELRQLRWADVTVPDDLAASERFYAEVASSPTGHGAVEKRYLRKDGSPFWAELHATAVRDHDGRLRHFIAVLQNVSARSDRQSRAAHVQNALLPTHAPPLEGYELAARCVPAQEVAGDFFDWYFAAPGHLTVTLGDVMGKGMSAAILMATVRSALRAGARSSSLVEGLRLASDTIALDFEHADTFVTLLHARLDQRTGLLSYIDAGHGYTFVLRPDGSVTHLRERGLPLGVLPEQRYREAVVELEPGSTFVAFSDGVTHVHPSLATDLGTLAGILAGTASADEVVLRLTRGADVLPQGDDVTVVALRRAGRARTSMKVVRSAASAADAGAAEEDARGVEGRVDDARHDVADEPSA